MKPCTLFLLTLLFASPALAATDSIESTVQALNLTQVEIHPDHEGPDAHGRLPNGGWIKLDFHHDGVLEEIETDHGALVPVSEIEQVLPGHVLGAERFPRDAMFEKIEFDHGKIEFEGRDAQGRRFKAEWNASGRLEEWKID